ncbi:MAG: hypothetical protein JOZ52_06410 [Acidobacteria bacterium]|nr:hypothetical protein [Acidobacteriota bacterium]
MSLGLIDDDSSIYKDVAESLLDDLGAEIFDQLFPFGENLDSAFEKLLQEIQQLIAIEAISNDILLIEGLLKGVCQQLSIDYVNLKNSSSTTKAELVSYLQTLRNSLEEGVTGPLQTIIQNGGTNSKSNAQQSLQVFLTGGSTLFSILQEMAHQDPTVSAPINSQYVADLKSYAETFAPIATTLLADIKAARLAAISGIVTPEGLAAEDVIEETPPSPEMMDAEGTTDQWPVGTHTCEYQVQDNWTGTVQCDYSEDVSIWTACVSSDAYSNASNCYASWLPTVAPQFDSDWASSSTTIAAWTTLSTNPLGTSTTEAEPQDSPHKGY